jgi:hypothetical protein
MPTAISQLGNVLTSSDIVDDADIRFGLDNLTDNNSYQLSLEELKRTGYQAVNIASYGAATGASDNAAAINAALAAAPAGSTVFIPHGTFVVQSTVVINKPVRLCGTSRGAEGNTSTGSVLKWAGAINGVVLRINDGTSGNSVHAVVVENLTIDGDAIAGVTGVRVGAGNDGSPRAAVGTLRDTWIYDCAYAGVDSWTGQIFNIHNVHAYGCGVGFRWSAGTNHANTAYSVIASRANNCTIGFEIRRLEGGSFISCVAEQCDDQGFYVETGGTNEATNNLLFLGCWTEACLQSGGTGRGLFQTYSSSASIRVAPLTLVNCEFGLPSAGNFNIVLDGASADIIDPALKVNQGIKMTSSSGHTYMQLRTRHDPTTYVSYVAGAGYVSAVIDHMVTTGNALERHQYVMDNSAPDEWESRTKNWFRLRNTSADATNKTMRIGGGHYTNSEEPLTGIVTTSTSGSGVVNVGGGSSLGNAATTVDIYAAANNTTTTGTKIASFVPGGITLSDGMNIVINATTGTKIGTGTTQKLGFWNATPVAQQVLATGAGRTVDEVITFLQTIGLCKQA